MAPFKHTSGPISMQKLPCENPAVAPMKKPPEGGFCANDTAGRTGSGAQRLLEFARLVHLHHDVRAADEFALDIKLGMVGHWL